MIPSAPVRQQLGRGTPLPSSPRPALELDGRVCPPSLPRLVASRQIAAMSAQIRARTPGRGALVVTVATPGGSASGPALLAALEDAGLVGVEAVLAGFPPKPLDISAAVLVGEGGALSDGDAVTVRLGGSAAAQRAAPAATSGASWPAAAAAAPSGGGGGGGGGGGRGEVAGVRRPWSCPASQCRRQCHAVAFRRPRGCPPSP